MANKDYGVSEGLEGAGLISSTSFSFYQPELLSLQHNRQLKN